MILSLNEIHTLTGGITLLLSGGLFIGWWILKEVMSE